MKLSLLVATSLLIVAGTSPSLAQDSRVSPAVLAAQEAALPPGELPAWETTRERAFAAQRPAPLPALDRDDDRPPPPAGYRATAEFEPLGAFLVTQGDWSTWGGDPSINMLIDMIIEGTQDGGAGAIVLTDDSVSSFESYLEG